LLTRSWSFLASRTSVVKAEGNNDLKQVRTVSQMHE
jgi:hypothetical protein